MRVLIADDEPALAEHLMQMLQRLDPNLSVCACVHDGRSALEALHAQRPDAAFIDIRMPAPNGLEVAAQAPSDCRIVFVTAYDQYAVPAFEHEAVDYLLKPVSTERLARTLGRLRERAAPSPEVLARLLGRLQNTPMPEDEFLRWIRAGVGERVRLVSVDEVLYCQARDKYTSVITPNREYVIRTPIKALVETLDPQQFWQVHRNTIANVTQIADVERDFAGRLVLRFRDHSDVVTVSRRYADRFRRM